MLGFQKNLKAQTTKPEQKHQRGCGHSKQKLKEQAEQKLREDLPKHKTHQGGMITIFTIMFLQTGLKNDRNP